MRYERLIYERTSLSELIENHAISNELSSVNLVKKDLHQHNRVLRRDREPSKISTNSGTFEEQEQKG